MDAGYTAVDLHGIDLNTEKERLYLVRMPQDVDVEQVIDLSIDKLFPVVQSTEVSQSSVTKNQLKAEIETDTSEVKTFRPVTVNSVDGRAEVGPAFEGVVSITKEVVPQNIRGDMQIKVGLPKTEIVKVPISYAKKDQMPAVQAYMDRTARDAEGRAGAREASVPSSSKKDSKKRKKAEGGAESTSKKAKSRSKRS